MGEYAFKMNIETEFHTVECFKCGNVFAVSANLRRHWKEKGTVFYCPSCGQEQCYRQTDIQILEEKLERYKKELDNRNERIRFLDKQVAIQKGQTTKLRNRISKGVCPCCNRSFQNLKRHIETKHPNYAEAV